MRKDVAHTTIAARTPIAVVVVEEERGKRAFEDSKLGLTRLKITRLGHALFGTSQFCFLLDLLGCRTYPILLTSPRDQ